jgi:predicted TIM-barrel fold metal-dependent hydrolase
MEIIDVHTHIFPPEIIARREAIATREGWFGRQYATPTARMSTAEQLLTAMDESGVARVVTFGFAFVDAGLCRLCNEYVMEAAARCPCRLLPFVVANPARPAEAERELAGRLAAGARGVGELMPDGQGFQLTEFARLDPLMALARAYGVPVLTHIDELVGHSYPGKGTQGPYAAYQMALRYPENVLILAHWGGGLPFYELMPEVRAALRNVYYDTAASHYLYEEAVFRHVMAWAPDKVLLGSDYPLFTFRRFLRRLERAGLDEEARARVLGGNAARLLGPASTAGAREG